MITTLAVIGALAILACFIRALGLKHINLEFESKPVNLHIHRGKADEEPPKQLN
jgi:hypothetical protein